MATRKKATSPDFYWVFWANELTELADNSPEHQSWYQALLQQWTPPRALDLNSFCADVQPAAYQLDTASFLDGSWISKAKSTALAFVYYKHAEEY